MGYFPFIHKLYKARATHFSVVYATQDKRIEIPYCDACWAQLHEAIEQLVASALPTLPPPENA